MLVFRKFFFAAFACAMFAVGCDRGSEAVFPGAEWAQYDTAGDAGFSEERLAALDDAVTAGNTHSMVVVKGGRVAYSYGDVAQTDGTYLASVRKSILTMMMGEHVDSGTIDIDASLADLGVDDVQGLTETEKTATVKDLISARSGIYHPASNFSGVTDEGPQRGDHAPGTYYWYNNWDFNAAGGVFEDLTGTDIYEAFGEQFAGPLQLQDWDIALHQENGKTGDLTQSKFPAYHFYLSARDLARLGLLMLRDGRWNGKQVIPADWVRESVAIATVNGEMNPDGYRESGFAYGYMWWVFDPAHFPPAFHGGYAGRGHFGQYLVVLPAVDLVIAHKTAPQDYDTPEEYEAVNVTWDEMRVLVDLTLSALEE